MRVRDGGGGVQKAGAPWAAASLSLSLQARGGRAGEGWQGSPQQTRADSARTAHTHTTTRPHHSTHTQPAGPGRQRAGGGRGRVRPPQARPGTGHPATHARHCLLSLCTRRPHRQTHTHTRHGVCPPPPAHSHLGQSTNRALRGPQVWVRVCARVCGVAGVRAQHSRQRGGHSAFVCLGGGVRRGRRGGRTHAKQSA